MCTAATYQTRDFYMGRTLDYEFSYGDQISQLPVFLSSYAVPFPSLCNDRHGVCDG